MPPKRASLGDRQPSVTITPRASDDTLMGTTIKRKEVEEILLRDILPNRRQPRSAPEDTNLDELAASIREHGVVQPIVVRPIALTLYEGAGRRYELVAGERRWRASALAGKMTIPAMVQTLDDRAVLELAIIENLQREDLNPLDEARALGQLRAELGYSFQQIADRLGKSKGYVQNRMELLDLPEDLQTLIATRPDAMSHARLLAKVGDDEQRAMLIAAVQDDALSLAETRNRVRGLAEDDRATNVPGLPATEAESYLRKYDAGQVDGEKQSYLRKYDPTALVRRLHQHAVGIEKLAGDAEGLATMRTETLAALTEVEEALAVLRRAIES